MVTQARPEELPEEYSVYGRSGSKELTDIAARVTRALEERDAHPDDQEAGLALEIAELEKRLFFVEHDNAGAFKTKKLNRLIRGLFEPGPGGEPDLGFDENGDLKVAKSLDDRRFMLVNMGELDRFNKEGGGHAAGDAALSATADAIEATVAKALAGKEGKQAEYSVYRFDGNTFAIDLASMPLGEFGKLAAEMQKAEPSVEGVKDPAPLIVRSLDFRDIVHLVNAVQAELPAGAKIDTADEAANEIFGLLRRDADWDMETSKFEQRAKRMRGKLDDPDAAAFFDNYMKKAFQGTELETLQGFREEAGKTRFEDLVDELALRQAEKRFAEGRLVDDQVQQMIDERVRERGVPLQLGERRPTPLSQRSRGYWSMEMRSDAARDAEAEAKERPEDRAAALRARKAKLELQIETAQRDAGTGLLDRGMHYERLEKAIEEDRDVAVVFVDMGFLKYFDQMGGTEVGNEALRKAAYLMEQAMQMSGAKGEVYRYGGDEFTVQIEGGADAAKDFIAILEELRVLDEAVIARTKKSRKEYEPTRLSFNYGLSDRVMLDELDRTAQRARPAPEGEQVDGLKALNAKAELMTKAADVGIEYNKAYSRFLLLIEALRDPEYHADPSRKMQTDSLIGFSNKALFAELGGAEHLRTLASDLTLEGDALEEAVLDFVVKKVGETRAREKGERSMTDALLAAQTKANFFKARVETLEEANRTLKDLNEAQASSLKKAVAQRDAAEAERKQIIATRGAIGMSS